MCKCLNNLRVRLPLLPKKVKLNKKILILLNFLFKKALNLIYFLTVCLPYKKLYPPHFPAIIKHQHLKLTQFKQFLKNKSLKFFKVITEIFQKLDYQLEEWIFLLIFSETHNNFTDISEKEIALIIGYRGVVGLSITIRRVIHPSTDPFWRTNWILNN